MGDGVPCYGALMSSSSIYNRRLYATNSNGNVDGDGLAKLYSMIITSLLDHQVLVQRRRPTST